MFRFRHFFFASYHIVSLCCNNKWLMTKEKVHCYPVGQSAVFPFHCLCWWLIMDPDYFCRLLRNVKTTGRFSSAKFYRFSYVRSLFGIEQDFFMWCHLRLCKCDGYFKLVFHIQWNKQLLIHQAVSSLRNNTDKNSIFWLQKWSINGFESVLRHIWL